MSQARESCNERFPRYEVLEARTKWAVRDPMLRLSARASTELLYQDLSFAKANLPLPGAHAYLDCLEMSTFAFPNVIHVHTYAQGGGDAVSSTPSGSSTSTYHTSSTCSQFMTRSPASCIMRSSGAMEQRVREALETQAYSLSYLEHSSRCSHSPVAHSNSCGPRK